jgi:hypothetical protein
VTTATNQSPDIAPPTGAHDVSDWTDVGTPDMYRTFTGPRREVRDNYVEAYGLQNADGSLEFLEVRASLDVWEHNVHHYWDNALPPLDARPLADRIDVAAAELPRWLPHCAPQPMR